MSSVAQALFVYGCVSVCISITIEWKPWINLPVSNSQILSTIYQNSIVIIGGTQNTNTIYTLNGSTTIKSNQTWQTISVNLPGSINIKNDNYLTIGHYTNIFGPSLNTKNMIYTYNHEINQFIQSQIPPPSNQVAYPCAVHSHEYIFLIGGVTYQGSNSLACESVTQAYSSKTKTWQTYSNKMPWDQDNNKHGACYNLCQVYNEIIYLFGGMVGGNYPTYLDHVYMLDIKNGPNFGMEWKMAGNISMEKEIINTHSLLVKDTIYTFWSGVQSIELSDPQHVKISFLKNDDLTPLRCGSGNVYNLKTNYIYAIGGEDCYNENKLYFNAQISQNMTSNNNNNGNWFSHIQNWIYFGCGFGVAILCVLIWMCCFRNDDSNDKDNALLNSGNNAHLQDASGNVVGFSREGSDGISTLSERPQVDI
eukprot:246753_1